MRPLGVESAREESWERWALGAVLLAAMLIGVLEVVHWRPGFSQTDESDQIAYLQRWREGAPLTLELFKGSLHRRLLALLAGLSGASLPALHGATWLAMGLEAWLLFRVGAALLSRRAALWALLACFGCANTWLRSRSLLSFSILPAETLLLLALLGREWGRASSAAFGAAAALLLADYEGAIVALPILAIFWLHQGRETRPRAACMLAGFAAVLALLLRPWGETLPAYLAARGASLPGQGFAPAAWAALRGFFWGQAGTTGPVGVIQHPLMAWWALPLFCAGVFSLWRRGRVLLLAALLGLAPLLSAGGPGEPSRLAASWPLLCLVAGQGAAWLLGSAGKAGRAGPLLALMALGGGMAAEWRSYEKSMSQVQPLEYAPSQALLSLKKAHPGWALQNEFEYKSGAPGRFIWGAGGGEGRELFLFRWELYPALKGRGAVIQEQPVSAALPPLLFFSEAPEAFKGELRAQAARLRGLHDALPRFSREKRLAMLTGFLRSRPSPLELSAALEEALKLSADLGRLDPELLYLALHAPLSSATAPLWLRDKALQAGDQAAAARLCRRAAAIDPRWSCP